MSDEFWNRKDPNLTSVSPCDLAPSTCACLDLPHELQLNFHERYFCEMICPEMRRENKPSEERQTKSPRVKLLRHDWDLYICRSRVS